jgi:hypothetical protein
MTSMWRWNVILLSVLELYFLQAGSRSKRDRSVPDTYEDFMICAIIFAQVSMPRVLFMVMW